MEAARDFIPFEDEGQGTDRCTGRAAGCGVDPGTVPAPIPGSRSGPGVRGGRCPGRTPGLSATAVEDAASWGLRPRRTSPGSVEELSRTVEYLQFVAASAVDRARKQSAADTGEGRHVVDDGLARGSPGSRRRATAAAGGTGVTRRGWGWGFARTAEEGVPGSASRAAEAQVAADDGYRNTAEFLRARLLISAAEARRRLSLAERLLPRRGLAGQPLPAVHEELGAAVAAGEVASRAATVITLALEKVRHACDAEAAGPDGARPDAHGRGERRRLPGPGRPQLDRRDRPGRRRTHRGAAAPAPGRLHPPPAPRPAPPRDLRDHRTIRTPPHRHEHRHQPPHRHHGTAPATDAASAAR